MSTFGDSDLDYLNENIEVVNQQELEQLRFHCPFFESFPLPGSQVTTPDQSEATTMEERAIKKLYVLVEYLVFKQTRKTHLFRIMSTLHDMVRQRSKPQEERAFLGRLVKLKSMERTLNLTDMKKLVVDEIIEFMIGVRF